MKGIPQGTPDYLRAQDIAMVSRTELKKDKKYSVSIPRSERGEDAGAGCRRSPGAWSERC